MALMNSLTSHSADASASIPALGSSSHDGDWTRAGTEAWESSAVPALGCSYIRVELGQGTSAWHDWRKQGIGASDAASILGENPFKTASAVMAEKLAESVETVDSPRVALGVALEPNARLAYCRSSGAAFEPACVQSTQYPWMRASLDGLSADGQHVIEIKCGRAAYWKAATTRRPPTYYAGQVQHILAVTGLPTIYFVCHFPPLDPIRLTIARDDAYIARLVRAEKEFWSRLAELRMARSSMAAAA